MLPSCLCSLLTLLLLLVPLLWLWLSLQVVQKIEYPIWVVYVTQAFMFGGGLAGISYGILSTSWDPRREGSALGWTELQVCWPQAAEWLMLSWWLVLLVMRGGQLLPHTFEGRRQGQGLYLGAQCLCSRCTVDC